MNTTPNGHDHPDFAPHWQPVPPDLRVPPPPSQPPRSNRAVAKVIGGLVGAVLAVVLIAVATQGPTPEPAPVTPVAASPSHKAETTEPKPRRAEEPAPEPAEEPDTTLTFKQLGKALKKGWPTVLTETPDYTSCIGLLDLVNWDSETYVGAAVVDPKCGAIKEQLLMIVGAVGTDSDSRYSHYVLGANWIVAFDSPALARAFAKGVGSGVTVHAF